MTFRRANVAAAVWLAIKTLEKQEKERGMHGESAQLDGWRTLLKALQDGEYISIEE